MKSLVALYFLLSLTPSYAQQKLGEPRVVIAVFGGLLGKAVKENVELYTKSHGIQAVFLESASADILAKIRAQKSAPQFDLALLNDQTFVVARSLNLLEKLDPAETPNARSLRAGLLSPDQYGAPYEINPVGYIYRRDKLAQAGITGPLDTWRAVLAPQLEGRVVTYTFSSFYTPLQMIGLQLSAHKSVRDGSEIWPFMAAMKARRTIVISAPGQAEELAKSGEAWVYPGTAERALLLRNQGVDIGFAPATDALLSLTNYMAPIKNAPHPINAQRVLNWILGPEVQTRMAEDGAVVPVNSTIPLSPALKLRMGFDPGAEIPAFLPIDVDALNDQFTDWSEQFAKTMAP